MNNYVNYKDGDTYNDKTIIRVAVSRQMNPRRKNRLAHRIFWKNIKCGTDGQCLLHNFGLNHTKHRNVQRGVNDIATVAPWMISWFKDQAIPYTHTVTSNHKVDWICPHCGTEVKNKTIANTYYYQKVTCPNCSDGISYPERLLFKLFTACGIDFEFHKTFIWSDKKIYDFYIKSLDMIIEAHGKQHYTNTWSQGVDMNYSVSIQDNDIQKEQMAIRNGITHYVVIDCRKSDYTYIKNNIESSILMKYFDFSHIDWQDIGSKSSKSIFMNVINSYKSNVPKEDILNMFKIADSTYYRYLKRAIQWGLLDESIKKRKKSTSPKRHIKRDPITGLTVREIEVCSLAVQNLKFKEIAKILGVAYTTVVEHKENAYKKLNIHSKEELILLYNSSGILKNLFENTNVCYERSETIATISNIH